MAVRGYDVTVKSITLGEPESTPEFTEDISEAAGGTSDGKGNPDTGVGGVAATVGIAAAAALTVVLTKKR